MNARLRFDLHDLDVHVEAASDARSCQRLCSGILESERISVNLLIRSRVSWLPSGEGTWDRASRSDNRLSDQMLRYQRCEQTSAISISLRPKAARETSRRIGKLVFNRIAIVCLTRDFENHFEWEDERGRLKSWWNVNLPNFFLYLYTWR